MVMVMKLVLDTYTPGYSEVKGSGSSFSVIAALNEAVMWEQWLPAGIKILWAGNEKNDPAGSLTLRFL